MSQQNQISEIPSERQKISELCLSQINFIDFNFGGDNQNFGISFEFECENYYEHYTETNPYSFEDLVYETKEFLINKSKLPNPPNPCSLFRNKSSFYLSASSQPQQSSN